METIEAVLSASGEATLRTTAGAYPVADEGDVAAARRQLLQAAESAVRDRGAVCRLIIDDMGTRHVFALHPDGSREPIADDGTGVAVPAPASLEPTRSKWRRENRPAHPDFADLVPMKPAPIKPVPSLPTTPITEPVRVAVPVAAAPALPPAPLLPAGPLSRLDSVPETTPAVAAEAVPAEAVEAVPVKPAGNPFIRVAEPEQPHEVVEPDEILGDVVEREGLTAPHMVRDAAPAEPAPQRPFLTPESVWLIGASGGVGVSTLASLAGGRVIDGGLHPAHAGAPVYVVAATHAAGLEAAASVARSNARGEITVQILGLILVHDRPKLSKASIQLARQIASLYPRTMTVPFMPAWRDPGTPEVGNNVRVKRVLSSLASKGKKKS